MLQTILIDDTHIYLSINSERERQTDRERDRQTERDRANITVRFYEVNDIL